MPKPEEIEKIMATFEETIAAHSIARGEPAGCIVCRRPDRKQINRAILEGLLNDHATGRLFSLERAVIVHHKLTCLPKFGGATFSALQRFEAQRKKLFPSQARRHLQKKFILDELLFLRDEALKKQPIDRKELLKLAKEIDQAADEYRIARDQAYEDKRALRTAPKNTESDFTPEQLREMERVGKSNGSADGVAGDKH